MARLVPMILVRTLACLRDRDRCVDLIRIPSLWLGILGLLLLHDCIGGALMRVLHVSRLAINFLCIWLHSTYTNFNDAFTVPSDRTSFVTYLLSVSTCNMLVIYTGEPSTCIFTSIHHPSIPQALPRQERSHIHAQPEPMKAIEFRIPKP